ncbi:hypothetical protein PHYPSEUDO_011544 [Phytophthora pseudosyringae]|uniref:Uncharacterized protein n=1 Tax=Phytophthora pseudosyringae TaxID=221518 RepID=A0A8T1VB35_9STRA|nr:hypothetical protein PHYPSEUDO_011544 [Phytophthora pseudosyringae]
MKKQKCTYTARREEAQKLQREVQRLASELQELQIRSLAPEDAALLDPEVRQVVAENSHMLDLAKKQQLHVASAQSMLVECLGDQASHPLYTMICLTQDWNERQKTLMAVRKQKLRNAYDFLMAPGRFVDPDKPHTSDQRYETAEGDICSWHLEAMHFPGVESLEQVWEALLFHYNNIEIGISERLGHTTVRDDYDAIEGSVYNTRVLSRSDNCTPLESSIVTFSHLFTAEDEGFGGHACGILALDSVDEDELYPYFPNERVRLDTSGAILLTTSIRPAKGADKREERNASRGITSSTNDEEGELVVTLRRAAFLKLYNPQFPVPEATRQELQEGIGRWGDVLMKTIRSYVYSHP